MWSDAVKQLKTAFILLLLFTLLTGFIYPLIVTGIAQLFFPWQANGSLIEQHNQIKGSQLIGQSFTSPHYFWGRPSSTSTFPYNAASSGASNFGPTNPDFLAMIKERLVMWQNADPNNKIPIPVELLMASGSGLDPDISLSAAFYQLSRVAAARGISEVEVNWLMQESIKPRSFGILGEPRVNVLELNLALDAKINATTTP